MRRDADRQDPCLGPGALRLRADRRGASRASRRWVTWCRTARSVRRSGRGSASAGKCAYSVPAQLIAVSAGRRARSRSRSPHGAAPSARSRARLVVAADGAQSAVRERIRRRRRGTRLRPNGGHHDRVAATLSRPRGLRALHAERSLGAAAAWRRALHPGADVDTDAGRCGAWRGRTQSSSPKCSAASGFGWADSSKRTPRAVSAGADASAARTSAPRCVIIGNAAQGLHPVAGMGFNLGLRDVASLAELIAERAHERGCDPGSRAAARVRCLARRGSRRRHRVHRRTGAAIFAIPQARCGALRNLGLLAFDLLPPAKSALSRLSTGAGGRIPKLARGVALAMTAARACDST